MFGVLPKHQERARRRRDGDDRLPGEAAVGGRRRWAAAGRRGCPQTAQNRQLGVVGEINVIGPQMRFLSHQTEVRDDPCMMVSHDLLMHRSSEWFVQQPPSGATVSDHGGFDTSAC
jgi:hypothetical protein